MERTAISRSGLGVALGVLREGLVRAKAIRVREKESRWEAGFDFQRTVEYPAPFSFLVRLPLFTLPASVSSGSTRYR